MAFAKAGRYNEILFINGRLAASTPVTVRLAGTEVVATLYTTKEKVANGPNPVVSDIYGNVSFYATPAYYDLVVSGAIISSIVVNPDPEEADTRYTATSHPDLAGHDALGLATQAELNAHAATTHGTAHPDLAAHDTLGLATQAELDAIAAAKANTSHAHVDADIPASIARDAEVTTAVANHEGAADPHVGYRLESVAITAADVAADIATQAELDAHAATSHGGGGAHPDLAAHDTLGLATQAELDAVSAAKANTSHAHVDADIPASIARDTEVTTAVSDHAALADPHTGYVLESLVDAAGDLLVGTGDNAVGRLARGTALQQLRVNAGGTALEYATIASGGKTYSTRVYARASFR